MNTLETGLKNIKKSTSLSLSVRSWKSISLYEQIQYDQFCMNIISQAITFNHILLHVNCPFVAANQNTHVLHSPGRISGIS